LLLLLLLLLVFGLLRVLKLGQLMVIGVMLVVESPSRLLLLLWSLISLHTIRRDCTRDFLY
jgi:hypothetical protein